ncbi:MAG: PTS glucose transporter subunit IIA [Mycoplasmataceae bacterium]|jgi:glucose-specific phosphotransferase system IIA component|nr:PTS glucose transporter subunit IIA [Mycoplasmataceae bacterium]
MNFFSKLFGKKNKVNNEVLEVCAPVDGEVIPTSQVKDETFSKDMIGRGFAVIPSGKDFVAPIDGELTLVAETGHAFSIKAQNGIEILIHIGIDTVNLNSNHKLGEPLQGFKVIAKTGDKVSKGAPIIEADLEFIKSKKLEIQTPVIILNNEFSANKTISNILTNGTVTKGTKILEVK